MDIIARDIKKSFGKQCVLKNISFSLKEGSITGLIGENGSGKTTIMKICAGLFFSDAGEFMNLPVNDLGVDVCCMLEHPSFNNTMTVLQNLKYYVDLKIDETEEFKYYIDTFKIDFLEKKFKHLSLGMKQRVGIVYMFLKKTKLILLDEITNGLDEGIVKLFYKELKKYVVMNKPYVLISSHKIYELQPVCSTALFLIDGEIKKEIDMKTGINKYKRICFVNSFQAEEFSHHIKKEQLIQMDNNAVVIKYDTPQNLKDILSIAVSYDIESIVSDYNTLEELYKIMNGGIGE